MSTLRDLLALLPHPGRRTCGLSHAIYVQLLILVVLLLGRRDAAACLAALAIIQILFIHVSTRRRERELLAELDLANTDMVTGLPTRRFVYRHIEAIPANDCVTVAFADVDNVKQINSDGDAPLQIRVISEPSGLCSDVGNHSSDRPGETHSVSGVPEGIVSVKVACHESANALTRLTHHTVCEVRQHNCPQIMTGLSGRCAVRE